MPAWLAAAAPAIGNLAGGVLGSWIQGSQNRKFAAEQHRNNMELLRYQLNYNSPANQMARFKEAGLNPNLIYGQGNAGNMESAPRYPDIQSPDIASAFAGIGTQIQQAKLMAAQTDLTKVKVDESTVKQDVMRAQQNLIKANPYLNKEYVDSMVLQLSAAAKLKDQESRYMLQTVSGDIGDTWYRKTEQGFVKMDQEMRMLFQRFNLNNADQQLKAQVLQSKEFQNALQEIQVNWMKSAEITPQHIFQGIMMLLTKMM